MAEKIDKPFYVNPTGLGGPRDLEVSPPFIFPGVTASMFPLQANISRLTDYCDTYLNMDIPDDIVHYFPALPYVYLAVINYGKLSPLLFSAQNTGWVAQDEVLFLIPLEVWRREGKKMVFKEWACVSPFIFVNNTVSLTTGREVYGWAKVLGHVDKNKSTWLKDPTAPLRVFGLSAPVFAKEYAGKREENRVLLEVERAAPASFSTLPPDPSRSALLGLPDAAKAWLGLAGSALDMATAWPVRGYRTTRSVRSTLEMTKAAAGQVLRLFPNPLRRTLVDKTAASELGFGRMAEAFANQITLKQFREAGDPDNACYQSLVSSRMGLDRMNRWGLLGDYSVLFGDPSGGYSIRLHQYEAYPIVDSLGLKVQRIEKAENAHAAILKPVFPFWTDVDLYYDKGKTICSRHRGLFNDSNGSLWQAGSPGKPVPEAPKPPHGPHFANPAEPLGAQETPPPAPQPPMPEPEQADSGKPIPYNTVRGGSTQAIAGPFHFPDATLQVYPLLATRDKLNEFIDNYLNTSLNSGGGRESGLWFEPFGDYVYLMLESVGSVEGVMWSETNNIGWWADKSVSFCVPVKMFKDRKFHSLALLTPYRFANDNRAVITDREINGRISVMSTIKGLPDVWLEESGPVKERKFLELSTETFPALDVGVKSESTVLLQINGDLAEDVYNGPRWRLVGERWRAPLLGELKRKTDYIEDHPALINRSKALALQILALKAPINWLNLKQYRDAEDPSRACYQSLVNVSRSIERVFDIREIEDRLFVRITDLPDFPIVKTLGLQVMSVTSRERVEQILQPIRPFWMRVSIKENLGETLAWQVERNAWNFTEAMPQEHAQGALRVGESLLDKLQPQRLQQQTIRWLFSALSEETQEIQDKLSAFTEQASKKLLAEFTSSQASRTRRKSKAPPCNSTTEVVVVESLKLAGENLLPAEKLKKLKKLFRSISTNDLYEVVEALTYWLAQAGVSISPKRFSAAEARKWLAELDDLQTVIEPILSDEWENWGDPRWLKTGANDQRLPRKPDFCFPHDTFQRDSLFGGLLNEKELEDLKAGHIKYEDFEKGLITLNGLRLVEGRWVRYEPPAKQTLE